jgi:cation-transporting P-type ATPase 13A3/4/5
LAVPLNFHKILHFYAHQGFRIIAMAYRKLDSKLAFHHLARLKRSVFPHFSVVEIRFTEFACFVCSDEVENDLTFVGLMIMRNNLKPESAAVIADPKSSDIQTVMVTGMSVFYPRGKAGGGGD